MKTRKSNRKSAFLYDRFEDRRLLAGDVQVFEVDGDLIIRGDAEANQVEVRGFENGDIVVSGLQGTRINGQEGGSFTLNNLGTVDGRTWATIADDLRIHMGKGDDLIRVETLNVHDRTVAFGSYGNDSIGFYATNLGDDLWINTYEGDDFVSLDEVYVGDNLALFTLDGADTVAIDASKIRNRTVMYTGDGNDEIGIRNSTHSRPVLILTGDGNDFVATDGLKTGSSTAIYLGRGNDELFIKDSTFRGWTVASGQKGNDAIQLEGDNHFRWHPWVRSFESNVVEDGENRLNGASVFTEGSEFEGGIFFRAIADGSRLGTIAELAQSNAALQTLTALVAERPDIFNALNDADNSFTVLAPTDAAFGDIAGIIPSLTFDDITNVLLYHVVDGAVFSETVLMLDGVAVETLLGQTFTVRVNEDPLGVDFEGFGSTAELNLGLIDIRAKNGVVHVINDVLIPNLMAT